MVLHHRHTVMAGEIERVEPQKDSMVIVLTNEQGKRGEKGTLCVRFCCDAFGIRVLYCIRHMMHARC